MEPIKILRTKNREWGKVLAMEKARVMEWEAVDFKIVTFRNTS